MQMHHHFEDNWWSNASRSTSETKTEYAQIEKEALAVTWSCKSFMITFLDRNSALNLTTNH